MPESQFVFGVDLDGVCADFYEGLRIIASEWLGVPLYSLTKEVTYGLSEWGIDTAGGYDRLHKFAVTQRSLFKELKPIKGAPQTLRKLSNNDVRIRIITNRLYIKYFHQMAARQTIEWLDQYDIPYWDLCFMRDKAAVGADLYIDDSPENVGRLRNDGHNTIVFTNSTNRDLPEPRADTWAEVEKIVLDELDKWKKNNPLEGLSAE